MSSLTYLKYIQTPATRDGLARLTARYLQEKQECSGFIIIKYRPTPTPFKIISGQGSTADFGQWKNELSYLPSSVNNGKVLSFKNKFYYLLAANHTGMAGYLWIGLKKPDAGISRTLKTWALLDKQLQKSYEQNKAGLSIYSANLTSQLLHDIEAIMQLIPPENHSTELQQRLKYQQKLNANILFYIRPLELIKERLSVRELIESSLQLLGQEPSAFSLRISPDVSDIIIDAEFFAKGFNEIIKNALYASKNDLSKISISIERVKQKLSLFNFDWCKITVHNKGKAIASDFLAQIFEPFFTTHKYEGFTGFGLSIAQKIFSAHNGSVEINSSQGRGTKVTIYLPLADE